MTPQDFLKMNAGYIRDLAAWLDSDLTSYAVLRHPITKENALKRIKRLQELLGGAEQAISSLENQKAGEKQQ